MPKLKDFLGALGAFLVDARWFVLAGFVGMLLCAKCAAAGTWGDRGQMHEPVDAAHNHAELGAVMGAHSSTVISAGSFGCKANEHRATLLSEQDDIFLGCATIDRAAGRVHIEWENGQTLDVDIPKPLPLGHTDGPAPEKPYQGGAVPDRNM